MAMGHVSLSLSSAISHVSTFPPVLHTPLHLQIFSQQVRRVKSGDLRTKKALSEIGECQKGKVLSLFLRSASNKSSTPRRTDGPTE